MEASVRRGCPSKGGPSEWLGLLLPACLVLSPPPARLVNSAKIGLLATVGVAEALVIPPPRVGIMSTGDELVEPGEKISGGFIRDSNRCDTFIQLLM